MGVSVPRTPTRASDDRHAEEQRRKGSGCSRGVCALGVRAFPVGFRFFVPCRVLFARFRWQVSAGAGPFPQKKQRTDRGLLRPSILSPLRPLKRHSPGRQTPTLAAEVLGLQKGWPGHRGGIQFPAFLTTRPRGKCAILRKHVQYGLHALLRPVAHRGECGTAVPTRRHDRHRQEYRHPRLDRQHRPQHAGGDRRVRGALAAVALTAHSNLALLEAAGPAAQTALDRGHRSGGRRRARLVRPAHGDRAVDRAGRLLRVVGDADVDTVVSAIVGSAGLRGTWAALEAGKTVALANKESLVVAGPLVMRLAGGTAPAFCPSTASTARYSRRCRPAAARRSPGGADGQRRAVPHLPPEQLAEVSVAEALAHPTWEMGPKITIDSATLMNKALEIIEARWLFDLERADRRGDSSAVDRPFDGRIRRRLGDCADEPAGHEAADPICACWPRAARGRGGQVELGPGDALASSSRPTSSVSPPWSWAWRRRARGGTAGAVLNGANEAAVAAFLAGRLGFHEIVPACRSILRKS